MPVSFSKYLNTMLGHQTVYNCTNSFPF